MNENDEAVLAGHQQELRRGTVVLATLAACRTPHYGYALLAVLSAAGVQVEANTLYPLLRRLELQGLLKSEWNTEESRPRKYYSVTDLGAGMADRLRDEWQSLNANLNALWKEDPR
ncbi:MAG: Transcriptional regulator, PadR family [Pseudarthrobacter sp.]|nr:Transcriptional regulator, PadR family [Pseudarthrobacter sp.]